MMVHIAFHLLHVEPESKAVEVSPLVNLQGLHHICITVSHTHHFPPPTSSVSLSRCAISSPCVIFRKISGL